MTAVQILGAQNAQLAPQTPQVHEEYPLVMIHPHARRAEMNGTPGTEIRDRMGNVIGFGAYSGQPDYKPPVTVTNMHQEAMHEAQGYRRGGVSDVAAFSNLSAGAVAQVKEPERYPMWLNGKTVNSAEEEAAARGGQATASPSTREERPMRSEDTTPRPRHVASPRKPSKGAPIGGKRQWSSERRAAYEASKAAP